MTSRQPTENIIIAAWTTIEAMGRSGASLAEITRRMSWYVGGVAGTEGYLVGSLAAAVQAGNPEAKQMIRDGLALAAQQNLEYENRIAESRIANGQIDQDKIDQDKVECNEQALLKLLHEHIDTAPALADRFDLDRTTILKKLSGLCVNGHVRRLGCDANQAIIWVVTSSGARKIKPCKCFSYKDILQDRFLQSIKSGYNTVAALSKLHKLPTATVHKVVNDSAEYIQKISRGKRVMDGQGYNTLVLTEAANARLKQIFLEGNNA